MPRQLWLADQCRRWGLLVTEVEGWKLRGSANFDPKGVIAHHTAGNPKGDYPSLKIVRDGRPGLPGPLSQIGLGRTGRVYVIASGRANHAGAGGWNGLSGNTSVIGIEAESVGTRDDWTDAQRRAYPILCAALLDGLGRDHRSLCAHREWAPRRKVDPAFWDMDQMRRQVRELLADGPATTPPPPTNPPEDDDMKPYLAQATGTPVYLIFPNGQLEAGVPTEAALSDARRIYGDKIEQVSIDFLRLHGIQP